jgi:hypothetical protein
MGPAEIEELLLQGQRAIENKTGRTSETAHLAALVFGWPQLKPIRLKANLHRLFFAVCSPHP